MTLTPARLLRLYPGLWRLRYGAEFLALLESAPITRAVVIDVLRAAAREWTARTRAGRLLLGFLVAEAAALCVWGATWALQPRRTEWARPFDSMWSVILWMLNGSTPLLVGSFLIHAKTRRDSRYAWVGLRHQLVALFLAAVWAQWTTFPYGFDGDPWYAPPFAIPVIWMLMLLLNVDRSREAYSPWRERKPVWWITRVWY